MSRDSERTMVLAAYVLHLFGAVVGITSLIGLVLNYVYSGRYDDVGDSHHRWMIRSFWWAIFWSIVGWVTTLLVVGWVVLFAVWAWYIYRHVRGLIALVNGEPMPR